MHRSRPAATWQSLTRCMLLVLSPLMLALSSTSYSPPRDARNAEVIVLERALSPEKVSSREMTPTRTARTAGAAPRPDVAPKPVPAAEDPLEEAVASSTEEPPPAPSLEEELMALEGEAALTLGPIQPASLARELLWLARAIYSESDRAHEQELVAWVIRNRVETAWQGRTTYRAVVLAPFQFSAFNASHPKRDFYRSLHLESDAPGWEQAVSIARKVFFADALERPFPISTRHFYSEQALSDSGRPSWALRRKPVRPLTIEIDTSRFRFYDGVI